MSLKFAHFWTWLYPLSEKLSWDILIDDFIEDNCSLSLAYFQDWKALKFIPFFRTSKTSIKSQQQIAGQQVQQQQATVQQSHQQQTAGQQGNQQQQSAGQQAAGGQQDIQPLVSEGDAGIDQPDQGEQKVFAQSHNPR